MVIRTILAAMATLAVTSASADSGALGAFDYSVGFTVSGYTGTSTLERFPALVRISENSPVGFYYSQLASDGSDLRFGDADSNPLSFEIEKWDPSGESLIWVSIPAMTNGCSFTMFYGGTPGVANYPTNVWTDYVGVWHMTEATGDVADSTGHGLTATPVGENAADSVAFAGGPAGNARQFATAQGRKTYLSIPSYDSFGLGGNFTIQGWFKATACYQSYSARYFSRKDSYIDNNGWEAEQRYGSGDTPATTVSCRGAATGDYTQTVPDISQNWLDLALNYNDKTVRYFVNGEAADVVTINAAATDNGKSLCFGNAPSGKESNWVGQMDEIRLRGGDVTADRMLAEHATIADAAFLTAGAVGRCDPSKPVLGVVTVTATSTNATVSGEITSVGAGATACDVYLALNDGEAVRIATGVTASFEYLIPDLDSHARYEYVISVSNNAETVMGTSRSGNFVTERGLPHYGAFKKSIEITVRNDLAATEITTGLPALVRLSTAIEGFDYLDFELENGQDMMFTDEAGTALPHEVDTWNESGESLVWVKLPSTAANTKIKMSYGGGGISTADPADVWSGYVGVWHLNEDGRPNNDVVVHDSTANGYDGTAKGISTSSSLPGKLGACWCVSDSSSNTDTEGGIIMESMTNVVLGTNFTVSGWIRHKDQKPKWDHLFYRKNAATDLSGWCTEINNESVNALNTYGAGNSGNALNIPDVRVLWAHYAVCFAGATAYSVENGVETSWKVISVPSDNGLPIAFGTDSDNNDVSWKGCFDELRIRKGEYDTNYLAAEYKAMNTDSEDIFAYGAAQDIEEPAGEWDIPGTTGGIRALDDGAGGKYITINAFSFADGALTVQFSAAAVDADGQHFTLICKENLTDTTTFPVDVVLENDEGGAAMVGKLTGLSDLPSLFVVGIGPAGE